MKTVFINKADLIEHLFNAEDAVLDVGFWGQGTTIDKATWPHALLKKKASVVYGLDLEIDVSRLEHPERYLEASAEDFSFDRKFNTIFAGDLIEHLPNPGLFLDRCRDHLEDNGRLILTTPNCFNLFNLTEKLSKDEPTVNKDHTRYFNRKTLKVLLAKCGYELCSVHYVYTLEYDHKESWKKKVLNAIYALVSKFTPKFLETLVVVAVPKSL